MFTKPPKTKSIRIRGPVRPFDVIPIAGSTKVRDDSDEAEDSDHESENPAHEAEDSDHESENSAPEAEDLDDNQAHYEYDQEALERVEHLYPRNAPRDIIPGFDQVEHYPGSQSDQKDLKEAKDEYSSLLKKITISRDQTEASNFEEERLWAIAVNRGTFTANDITEQIPPVPSTGNHALQDYQMQLMLLEQQNKKRLLMARQQPENLASGISDLSHSEAPETSFPPTMSFDERQSLMHALQRTLTVPSTGASTQSHSNARESELVSRLLRRIDVLERGTRRSEDPPVQGFSPPRFQILHQLDDRNKTVCLQEPTWTFGKAAELQLKAELPLVDLDTHLRKNEDISFLVYRSYETPIVSATELAESLETGVLSAPEASNEFIKIMSAELRVALQFFLRSACSVEEEQLDVFLDTLEAPYLFWYRGRSNRQTLSRQLPKHQAHLELLFDWIERNYATKFNQFDEMISRGRISHTFVEYLFFPGDVVVNRDGDKTKAYRLQGMSRSRRVYGRNHHSQGFEKLSRARSRANERTRANEAWAWDISCSTIVYDGEFFRESNRLILELVAESHDEEVDITELTMIPLLFVGKDLQEQLMQRGRTFWSCRIKRPISYNGGDEDASHTV
jgi:hypothetical protein